MTAGVGADIEALCNKCGDVWHVVVAKVGEDIVKVQCKECGGYHRYRSSKPAAPRARATRRSTSRSARTSSSRASATAVEAPRVRFAPDPSAEVKPYSMRETFQTGDHIQHPRFGLGVVDVSAEPGKMEVLFADGRKVLAQAKPSSRLLSADEVAPILPASEE